MTTDKKRRSLAKALAASSGAVVLGKTLPEGWITPVVEDVVLPAHAQTSSRISCTVEDTDGPCGPEAIEFRVFGTIAGGNLVGAILVIEYLNGSEEADSSPDCGGGISSFITTTVVQPGNTFDETVVALPPAGEGWCDPAGVVRVRFQNQAAYGSDECSDTHNCEEVKESN